MFVYTHSMHTAHNDQYVNILKARTKISANRELRVPSHVSGMRCVFARNHESERDSLILLSLSLSWFCAKTERIPDTWDGTLRHSPNHYSRLALFPPYLFQQ